RSCDDRAAGRAFHDESRNAAALLPVDLRVEHVGADRLVSVCRAVTDTEPRRVWRRLPLEVHREMRSVARSLLAKIGSQAYLIGTEDAPQLSQVDYIRPTAGRLHRHLVLVVGGRLYLRGHGLV